ncbi:TPA: phospholipase D family protein [Streptococcus suis]
MLLVKNIFENIFETVDSDTEVEVITGYSSGKFIEFFINCFKDVRLEVFIGMSQQGISESDHLAYKRLMLENPKVRIYYQVKGSPTHIKMIKVIKGNISKAYVGSSNFSFDGMFKHNELMTTIDEKTEDLFNKQKLRSVLVDSEEAKQVVFQEELPVADTEVCDFERHDNVLASRKKQFIHKRLLLRRDGKYFSIFQIPLKALAKYDISNRVQLSIKLPIGFATDKYFPFGKKFFVFFEGQILKCSIGGKFSSELHVESGGEFILEDRLYSDKSVLVFERFNENEYSLSFSNQ